MRHGCIAGRLVTRGGARAEAHRVRRVGVLGHDAGDAVGEEALAGLQGDRVDEDEPAEAVADLLQQLLHPHAGQGVADQVDVVQIVAVDHLHPARALTQLYAEFKLCEASSETELLLTCSQHQHWHRSLHGVNHVGQA